MQNIFSFSRRFSIVPFILLALGVGSCNKGAETITPALPGNEFLTTVELYLVNAANPADVQTAIWTQISPYTNTYQPDSTYVNLASLTLQANSTYNGQVYIFDETKTPWDTVSIEIKQRENYHLFFFQPSPIAAANVIVSNTTTSIPMSYWNTGLGPTDTTAGGVSINELLSPPGNPLNLTVTRTDLDANTPPMQIGLTGNFVTGAASAGILRVVLRHQPNAKNGTYPPGSTDLDVTYAVTIQ
ncbi:MAG: hypothetical protein ACHP6H_04505 [Legionellales bacterium]